MGRIKGIRIDENDIPDFFKLPVSKSHGRITKRSGNVLVTDVDFQIILRDAHGSDLQQFK